MKFQMLAFFFFFFILLCAQFTSNLALESKAAKDTIDMNGSSHVKKEGLMKHEALVVSKATGGKATGSTGGQNINRPSDDKKNKATSMLISSSSNIIIGVISLSMILVFNF